MIIGYARVSSTGQNLDVQIEKLTKAGCEKIFQEKESGKSADNRIELNNATEFVREGDVLVITKLDRLARSINDLTSITDELNKKGAGFIVVDKDIDTTTPTGKLLFNILGSLAEFERDLIKARCAEGIERAKANGVKLGRKPSITEETIQSIKAELANQNMGKAEIAKKHGVSRQTVYRLIAEDRLTKA